MDAILRAIETPYVDAQTLLCLLGRYRKPREWILRKVNSGELIRLRNGFYLISDKIKQAETTVIPFEQVANLLYGPSYVSLEWALSFYGLIPERVHTVTSMVLGRSKTYATPIGEFSYTPLSSSRYAMGIDQKKDSFFKGGFLMACPEKALADFVFKRCSNLGKNQLKVDLVESKRLDLVAIKDFDEKFMIEIAKCYRSKIVFDLVNIIVGH